MGFNDGFYHVRLCFVATTFWGTAWRMNGQLCGARRRCCGGAVISSEHVSIWRTSKSWVPPVIYRILPPYTPTGLWDKRGFSRVCGVLFFVVAQQWQMLLIVATLGQEKMLKEWRLGPRNTQHAPQAIHFQQLKTRKQCYSEQKHPNRCSSHQLFWVSTIPSLIETWPKCKAVGFGCFPLIFVEMSGRGEK